jgi:hypothetical protein
MLLTSFVELNCGFSESNNWWGPDVFLLAFGKIFAEV